MPEVTRGLAVVAALALVACAFTAAGASAAITIVEATPVGNLEQSGTLTFEGNFPMTGNVSLYGAGVSYPTELGLAVYTINFWSGSLCSIGGGERFECLEEFLRRPWFGRLSSAFEPEARGACTRAVTVAAAEPRNVCALAVRFSPVEISLLTPERVGCTYEGEFKLKVSLARIGTSGLEYTLGTETVIGDELTWVTGNGLGLCVNEAGLSGSLGALSPTETITLR